MSDFRRIDDPSRQAHLAERYEFWNGVPGYAGYRLACHACGKPFYAKMPTARWCSDGCARQGAKRRRLVQARARREAWRSCRRCGKPFRGRRADAEFCSNACRQAAYRVTATGSAEFRQPIIRNGPPAGDPGAAKGTEGGLPRETAVSSVPLINPQRRSKVCPHL